MRGRNTYRIAIGILLLITGGVTLALASPDAVSALFFITAGIVFLGTGIIRHRRYGDSPESDERSKKIGAYGLSYAWVTGLFFMCGLFWLDYLGIVRIDTQQALVLSIVVLGLSAAVYQAILFRRGDVG